MAKFINWSTPKVLMADLRNKLYLLTLADNFVSTEFKTVDWAPSLGGTSTLSVAIKEYQTAWYCAVRDKVDFFFRLSFTTSGTAGTRVTMSLPGGIEAADSFTGFSLRSNDGLGTAELTSYISGDDLEPKQCIWLYRDTTATTTWQTPGTCSVVGHGSFRRKV